MKAAILYEARTPLVIEDVQLGAMRADEVRIRVVASGLCHSDYHVMTGTLPHPMPVVLGHEASGIVEAVGENVRNLKPGDTVVTCVSTYCGECTQCQHGNGHICTDKPARPAKLGEARLTCAGQPVYQIGQLGAFAEEMLVHAHSVTKLPEGMPMDIAALLGCAVITGMGAVLHRAHVQPGETVAVIGCGGIGLNVVQGAKLAGASRIIAVDLNPAKLELAKLFGATDCIRGGETAVAELREMTGGGVDYAFEVIGLPATMRQAFLMLRKRGAAVLIGVPRVDAELSVPAISLLLNETRIISSLMGSSPHQVVIPQYAQLYLNGKLILDPLISQKIRLQDIDKGYEQLAAGTVARSVIMFE
jgi:S-(hydroxymethyl)glutathione dehydrogenase/alcohol dehydrogenase